MGFSTTIFIFAFFPLCLSVTGLVYFIGRRGGRIGKIINKLRLWDLSIISFGIVFYAFSGLKDMLKLVLIIVAAYAAGLLMDKLRNGNCKIFVKGMGLKDRSGDLCKIICCISVSCMLFLLFQSKYLFCLSPLFGISGGVEGLESAGDFVFDVFLNYLFYRYIQRRVCGYFY